MTYTTRESVRPATKAKYFKWPKRFALLVGWMCYTRTCLIPGRYWFATSCVLGTLI